LHALFEALDAALLNRRIGKRSVMTLRGSILSALVSRISRTIGVLPFSFFYECVLTRKGCVLPGTLASSAERAPA
jgi:hypothetical protein